MKTLSPATEELLQPLRSAFPQNFRLAGFADETLSTAILKAERWSTLHSEWLTAATNSALFELMGRMPERKQLERGEWMIPITDISALILERLVPSEVCEFEEELQLALNAQRLRSLQYDVNAERYSEFKLQNKVPPHSLVMHPERPLAPYQQIGALNALQSEGYALFKEQGTGKTATAIAVLNTLAAQTEDIIRAIIVAPNNVRSNWKTEIANFTTVETRSVVMRGLKMQRLDCLLEATRPGSHKLMALIVGYDTLCNDFDLLKAIPWDVAILDESHYIKSATTRRWEYAERLRDISSKRLVLTGTPITNSMLDLYTQLEFCGKGFSGFHSWKGFRSFHGVYDRTEEGFEKLVGCTNVPFMQERLARYSFIIRKEEALPYLPDKVYSIEEIEMTDEQATAYRSLSNSLMLEIENVIDSATGKNAAMVVNNILTMLLRLAQITSGYITIPEERDDAGNVLRKKEIRYFDKNPKLDRLGELLCELKPESKALVWTCWTSDIHTIKERCDELGIGAVTFFGGTSDKARAEAERRFNCDPDCRVFIGNPAAGGVGLNLLGYDRHNEETSVTNADHVFYYAQNWSAVTRSQSEDRSHRRGTRENVHIIDLCIPETIDEEIRARVVGKITSALEISDIRNILENVKGR